MKKIINCSNLKEIDYYTLQSPLIKKSIKHMNLLQQHITSIPQEFNSVKTELNTEKVTGAQRVNNNSNHSVDAKLGIQANTVIRNYLTKSLNGTISIHQLTSFNAYTSSSSGAQMLTVFLQHAMPEDYGVNAYDANRVTFFNGNTGTLQRTMKALANHTGDYNAISVNATISNALIPINASKWDNVEDNKIVFAIFGQIKKAAEDGDTEQVQNLWNGYERFVEKQLKANKLINSMVYLANENSIVAFKFPFINTNSSNPNWNGSKLYGSLENKQSFMPYTSTFNGIAIKTVKESVEESLQCLIKQNYLFGLRNPKKPMAKASKSNDSIESNVFDPAGELAEEANDTKGLKVNAVMDLTKVQVTSSLLLLNDSNGRDSVIQLSISDVNGSPVIKRTNSFESLKNGELLSFVSSPILPRSLNGKLGSGVSAIGIDSKDGVLVNTLAVTFEIIKPVYHVVGSRSTSNSVFISDGEDLGLLDDLMSSLTSSDDIEVVDIIQEAGDVLESSGSNVLVDAASAKVLEVDGNTF